MKQIVLCSVLGAAVLLVIFAQGAYAYGTWGEWVRVKLKNLRLSKAKR